MKTILKTGLIFLVIFLGFSPVKLRAQQEKKSSWINDKIGWDINALPSVSYDADKGFQYGLLIKPFDYDNPSLFPLYKHLLYAEWSHTTNGNDLKQFKYDSEHLIPGVRLTGIVRLETEKAMDFYGFNGYESLYNHDFEIEEHDDYISRLYYSMAYRSLRIKTEFQGQLIDKKLRWYAGLAHYNIKAGPLENSRFKNLPDVPTLFDEYVAQGIIPADQSEGGFSNLIKLGLVADTRDFEPFPTKGVWTEAYLTAAPGFIGNESPFTGMVFTHRHYLPLIKEKLILAYRINYQTTLSGDAPWYVLSFKPDTFTLQWEGLGGYKTLRGIRRNRVVGEGAILGNFELRWKSSEFKVLNKPRYIALTGFTDVAKITKKYHLQPNLTGEEDGFHISYGGGLYLGLNPNFIIHFQYGLAADPRDGQSGTYIGVDFLF